MKVIEVWGRVMTRFDALERRGEWIVRKRENVWGNYGLLWTTSSTTGSVCVCLCENCLQEEDWTY